MEQVFIAVQDHTGDSKFKLSWDKSDQEAKTLAKETFLDLKEKGYRIYSVKKVLGFINVKGKEMENFNPEENEFYYIKDSSKKNNTFTKEDIEADNIRYEEAKIFDPEKEEIDTKKDYVATKPFYAG